ncbi:MAG TPA: hypothetical protein VMJ70_00625 [Candidatus Sulfotelmatobacter sp.]|nr:hypothetical protein [Candidatus Sulfotelmatobacter sp.]
MKRILLSCAMLLGIAVAANAADVKTTTGANGKPRFEASDKITAESTVLSVNKTKRTLKIVNADGDTVVVECGPEVKNFAQIKAKDKVTVTYTEKLVVEVAGGPGSPAAGTEATSTSAKPGEKPKGSMTQKTHYKATITAIDKAAGTVALKGVDGHEITITPRNKANLDKVAVGDVVTFTYTENLAASVTTPAAAK